MAVLALIVFSVVAAPISLAIAAVAALLFHHVATAALVAWVAARLDAPTVVPYDTPAVTGLGLSLSPHFYAAALAEVPYVVTAPLHAVASAMSGALSLLSCVVPAPLASCNAAGCVVLPPRREELGIALIALGVVVSVAHYGWHVATDRRWQRDSGRWLAACRLPLWGLFREYFEAECFLDTAEVKGVRCPAAKDGLLFMDGYSRSTHHPTEAVAASSSEWAATHVFPDDGHTNYLAGHHPHGFLSLGCWTLYAGMGAATSAWSRLFSGRGWRVTQHTMAMNFKVPLWGDLLMTAGYADVSRRTLMYALTRGGRGTHAGRYAMLVPGGAVEAVDAANAATLSLKRRKGFVKLALETGAAVVPTYCFGETETFRPLSRRPAVLGFMRKLQGVVGLGCPPAVGRWWCPILPHRVPLTLVVGAPLTRAALLGSAAPPPGQHMEPTREQVEAAHAAYVAALSRLYERNQPRFDPDGPPTLTLR